MASQLGFALAALFSPTLRAVKERLYQSEPAWLVDSGRCERTFGWVATPLEEAIRSTLAWFREESTAT
jgi:hypothetical protein